MNEKTLWIMCGVPGSGKSTWLRQNAFENSVVISRDAIRFAMLDGEDEAEYFKYEDKVWNKFINDIRTALTQNDNVYVDATHINEASRNKLLNALHLHKDVKVNCIFFDVPDTVCLARNEMREGRSRVPRGVIRRMSVQMVPPHMNEKHKYNKIFYIDENGKISKEIGGE